jgi:hypothetical protein
MPERTFLLDRRIAIPQPGSRAAQNAPERRVNTRGAVFSLRFRRFGSLSAMKESAKHFRGTEQERSYRLVIVFSPSLGRLGLRRPRRSSPRRRTGPPKGQFSIASISIEGGFKSRAVLNIWREIQSEPCSWCSGEARAWMNWELSLLSEEFGWSGLWATIAPFRDSPDGRLFSRREDTPAGGRRLAHLRKVPIVSHRSRLVRNGSMKK